MEKRPSIIKFKVLYQLFSSQFMKKIYYKHAFKITTNFYFAQLAAVSVYTKSLVKIFNILNASFVRNNIA